MIVKEYESKAVYIYKERHYVTNSDFFQQTRAVYKYVVISSKGECFEDGWGMQKSGEVSLKMCM